MILLKLGLQMFVILGVISLAISDFGDYRGHEQTKKYMFYFSVANWVLVIVWLLIGIWIA